MRATRPALLVAATLLAAAAAAAADPPSAGHHETRGPVRALWATCFDGPISGADYPWALAMSPTGEALFVSGQSDGTEPISDYTTIGYHAGTGGELWRARYQAQGLGARVKAIATSPDGKILFVTGSSDGLHTRRDYDTVAYGAASGKVVWTARYATPSMDQCAALAVDPAGERIYVTGTSYSAEGTLDQTTVAYDVATGEETWVARFGTMEVADNYSGAMAVSPDGSTVFVIETLTGWQTEPQFLVVAYDAASGAEIWHYLHDDPAVRSASRVLAVSPDSSTVYVTGWVTDDGDDLDFLTIALNATTGDEIWATRFLGSESESDYVGAIAVHPDGSAVYVTGMAQPTGATDGMITIAYDVATAEEIWVALYNAPGSDVLVDAGTSIVVHPAGEIVWVSGNSRSFKSHDDFATVAYDTATGEEICSARYDGGGTKDWQTGMVVSPDGATVFVTGGSEYDETGWDIATVAYEAVLRIDIDVTPGLLTNFVNLFADTAVPVVLLGGAGFDVTEIDVETLVFGPERVPASRGLSFEDVNLDGILDLVASFGAREAGFTCDDLAATLSGRLRDRRYFEGEDAIAIMGCRQGETSRFKRGSGFARWPVHERREVASQAE